MTAESIFLLPNGTFFIEIVIFAALLWVVAKYILPPLNRMIERRQERIRVALAAADEAQSEAAAAADERAKLLADARNQARDIVANAQATSDQVKAEAGARGQAEYDRIVAAAAGEVAAIRQRAIDEAADRISEVVYDLVHKIVGREADEQAHQGLVNDAVQALRASGSELAAN